MTFGGVIRFMAGLDSIAQAAGQCNRNGRRVKGSVYVVNPQVENLDKLPDICRGAMLPCGCFLMSSGKTGEV